MSKIYIVVKEKNEEAKIESFDHGLAISKEYFDRLDWVYFAKSEADAKIAIDNLFKEDEL